MASLLVTGKFNRRTQSFFFFLTSIGIFFFLKKKTSQLGMFDLCRYALVVVVALIVSSLARSTIVKTQI